MCGNHRENMGKSTYFFFVMNGNLYNDVMYVYTIGNEGNPKLDFLHTLADLNHLRISYIDRVLWVYLVLFFGAEQDTDPPIIASTRQSSSHRMIRLEMSLEDGAKLSSSTQTSRKTCVFECVYEGMPPNGNFDNANTWCLNMIMFINFQPRDLRGVVFFLANSFWGSCKKTINID